MKTRKGNKMIRVFFFLIICSHPQVKGQCLVARQILDSLLVVQDNALLSDQQKLEKLMQLKSGYELCKLPKDSVYARLLHRIGSYFYFVNQSKATKESIEYTLEAVRINSSGSISSSPDYLVNSYYNLGIYYNSLNLYNKALVYYDSAVLINSKRDLHSPYAAECRLRRTFLLTLIGDYLKSIEECTKAISEAEMLKDTAYTMKMLNMRAQSYLYLRQYEHALSDIETAKHYAKLLGQDFELASAIKIEAQLFVEQKKQYKEAIQLFEQCIQTRIKTHRYFQISDDYTDLGNFFMEQMHDPVEGKKCYLKALEFARKNNDEEQLSKGYTNLSNLCLRMPRKDLLLAEQYNNQALQKLGLQKVHLLANISLASLSSITNKDLLLSILKTRTELLLDNYKYAGQEKYLQSCFSIALLTDSVITEIRHEQWGEQSKLYWRDHTRSFFETALEACYIGNNSDLAFFFMEKSRAVLLNDKLNELGAMLYLPAKEGQVEHDYKFQIATAQQQLNNLPVNTPEYQKQQLLLLQIKEDFERYIKTLEKKYPVYYQYKYADNVPQLSELKACLKNNESFVHYFFQDTVAYILSIIPGGQEMFKLGRGDFNFNELTDFMQWCADKQRLNNQFFFFASLSNRIYSNFFKPLQLPKGRVILCLDNFLLPFEALCTDSTAKHFLIKDFMFSYVYSASYFMKPLSKNTSLGSFVGFAPVSFREYLSVPDLKNSAKSLRESGKNYDNPVLYISSEATRNKFITQMSEYSVVNVFSHAMGDTGNTEPVLFMFDSTINLSELQMLNRPATQLIMLSACQTNVGRNARGEGIYSLARGFSSAGVASVTATLWKADEEAIYKITSKFHEYLSKGMHKDEALQKAKLFYVQTEGKENLLPYYWANMILIGSCEPIIFPSVQHKFNWMLYIGGALMVLAVGFVLLLSFRMQS